MSEASEEIYVLVLEDRISSAEIEFVETSEEMREPIVEEMNTKAKEWTVAVPRPRVSNGG